ncbi:hypothetical protein CEXT_277751 [Caerostris extrusa]|uniref:Uncharacterized protein n=1 Tax=Caerostris extrusa TaxID=172846 RepID=A0AAV4NII7_CAEEX|nr:hypothetical protein CEXT_277751 [Caerostris extrusa]
MKAEIFIKLFIPLAVRRRWSRLRTSRAKATVWPTVSEINFLHAGWIRANCDGNLVHVNSSKRLKKVAPEVRGRLAKIAFNDVTVWHLKWAAMKQRIKGVIFH